MHHQRRHYSQSGLFATSAMHHQLYSLSGRQRRRVGIQNMISTIRALEQQVEVMQSIILDQQHDLETLEAALDPSHATPVLNDATLSSTSTSTSADHALPAHLDSVTADHASPVLFDMFDTDSDATADHASPELFDA
eukprot:5100254-Karenia_brevis.AAC.1